MAAAAKKGVRKVKVSVFFNNGQATPFILDPKTDVLDEKSSKELVIKRGDDSKAVIRIRREAIAYYVVSAFIDIPDEKKVHPAFNPSEDTEIDFR